MGQHTKPRSPRIKLVVTDEIIRGSINRDSSHCMLAEALQQSYPQGIKVSVDLQTIRVSDPKRRLRYTYLTPRRAQVALIQFDQGISPQPFDITLRNGQVTKMADSAAINAQKRAEKVKDSQAAGKLHAGIVAANKENPLRKATLRKASSQGTVPDRIGGKTPPLQKLKDKVPFSRRRAFGLRGMDM